MWGGFFFMVIGGALYFPWGSEPPIIAEEITGMSYDIRTFLQQTLKVNLETRQSNNLYTPQAILPTFQKGAYYSVIKIFNKLPSNIKTVHGNVTKFKATLKKVYI
jgi:hypothetical protein